MQTKEEFIQEILNQLGDTKENLARFVFGSSHWNLKVQTLAERIKVIAGLDIMLHDDPAMLIEIVSWGQIAVLNHCTGCDLDSKITTRGKTGTAWLLELAATVVVSEILKNCSIAQAQCWP